MRSVEARSLADAAVAAVGLVVLAPLMLGVALLIRRQMGAPVLFRQVRAGWKGQPFVLLKFRTMRDSAGPDGQPLPDEERLTRLGRFLRSSSLDELPELLNVVRGQMALVGPRPLLMEYVDRYTPQQARRLEVKPGVTGWAQVQGRNALSWEERFMLDAWYVDHRSVGLDVRILWRTLAVVLRREGISACGHATMPVFQGSRERAQ